MNEGICPFCFKDGMGKNQICRCCGYDVKKAQIHRLGLPQFKVIHSRYVLGCVLGSGGFGITYKAWDISSRSVCAVKEFVPLGIIGRDMGSGMIYPLSGAEEDNFEHGKQRFLEEACTLMNCRSIPGVVKIFDSFEENGTAYYTMEYLSGRHLARYTRERGGRLPLTEAWSIIRKAGVGLARVHSEVGIFHRDISPANIMVEDNGEVKLIDFGSAKYLTSQKSQELSVVIKPGYAPPEQYSRNGRQGTFTDVYALAATFYYILTGENVPDALDRINGRDYVPLSRLDYGIPESISIVVDRALRLRFAERTQRVEEFLEMLDREINGKQTRERQPYLKICQGEKAGKKWTLVSDVILYIGRDAEKSHIVVGNDGRISGRHLEVRYNTQENRFHITDRSTNGVYYQNQRLKKNESYQINPGDELELGFHLCRIQLGVEEVGTKTAGTGVEI